MNEATAQHIKEDKTWRAELDAILQQIKVYTSQPSTVFRSSRERSLAVTKIQEAIMWLGMDLKAINETPSPYPESYNPTSPKIEPTADGLKL